MPTNKLVKIGPDSFKEINKQHYQDCGIRRTIKKKKKKKGRLKNKSKERIDDYSGYSIGNSLLASLVVHFVFP